MSEPNYDEIRKRITKRYENRAEFYTHLVTFIVVNALLWSEIIFRRGWLLYGFTALWFIGLVAHLINYVTSEAREKAIEQAIERERGWMSDSPACKKLKREDYARLSDDGELLEIVEDEWETRERRRS